MSKGDPRGGRAAAPRASGLLLHVSSLPSRYGIGDLGHGAYQFAAFLGRTEQRLWQILPLNPTALSAGNSPYQSRSVFAGNPLFISPDLLIRDGFLPATSLPPVPAFPGGRVDYEKAAAFKAEVLSRAFTQFRRGRDDGEFGPFCEREGGWLDDYSLFQVLRKDQGNDWASWPEKIRRRDSRALAAIRDEREEDISREKFYQYLFYRQWAALRNFCRRCGVRLFGDLPIYPTFDSADLWSNPSLFKIDGEGRPLVVAGVPPDYFSATGQLWGNPVYDWKALRRDGFRWWVERMEHNLRLFDLLRIDHFRGLVSCWEIPAGEETAVNGEWVPVPAEDLFSAILEKMDASSFVAEDLGTITPDVVEVRRRFGFPGMRVLLFAFGDEDGDNPHRPHTYERDCVVYTGTHDNNTARGWFEEDAGKEEKRRLRSYIGRDVGAGDVPRELVSLAMNSPASRSVVPLQDLIGLGGSARMNRPSTATGNWEWRLEPGALTPSLEERLLRLTVDSGRTTPRPAGEPGRPSPPGD